MMSRIAFRQLRKSPAFALVVLATLGFCIGVNTAIYSVLDSVLRGEPYTFSATAGILLLVTVLASLVPALRILRLDPARILESE